MSNMFEYSKLQGNSYKSNYAYLRASQNNRQNYLYGLNNYLIHQNLMRSLDIPRFPIYPRYSFDLPMQLDRRKRDFDSIPSLSMKKNSVKNAEIQTEDPQIPHQNVNSSRKRKRITIRNRSSFQTYEHEDWNSKSRQPSNYEISFSSFKESESFTPTNKFEQYLYNCIILTKKELNQNEQEIKENPTDDELKMYEESIDCICESFISDFFSQENELHFEEDILNEKSKQNIRNGKPIFLNDSNIMFEGDLDKRIKFISDRISKKKMYKQKCNTKISKNRRMYSAPQNIIEIQQSNLSNSAKDLMRFNKLNQKLIINGDVFILSQIIDRELQETKQIVYSENQWKLPLANHNPKRLSARVTKKDTVARATSFIEKSKANNSFGLLTKNSIDNLKDTSQIFGKLLKLQTNREELNKLDSNYIFNRNTIDEESKTISSSEKSVSSDDALGMIAVPYSLRVEKRREAILMLMKILYHIT